jgi:folate-dependent phosphoribosylglycinamide formyltransferase PurN
MSERLEKLRRVMDKARAPRPLSEIEGELRDAIHEHRSAQAMRDSAQIEIKEAVAQQREAADRRDHWNEMAKKALEAETLLRHEFNRAWSARRKDIGTL